MVLITELSPSPMTDMYCRLYICSDRLNPYAMMLVSIAAELPDQLR